MLDLYRLPDRCRIETEEGGASDAVLDFALCPEGLDIFVTATASRPKWVSLRWCCPVHEEVKLCGDSWERGYGDFSFGSILPHRAMPWYFFAVSEAGTDAVGVAVQPNAFVSWTVDSEGVTAWCDLRCGSHGVALDGRKLFIARVLSRFYPHKAGQARALSVFDAASDFCSRLSPAPLLPAEPVYGGNNWYYAYGKSSFDEIVSDASLQAALAEGQSNRPFMVIDDGWQINSCAGPWRPNDRYGDMKKVTEAFYSLGVRPGLWIRPLHDPSTEIPAQWRFAHRPYLDPSVPAVLDHLKNLVHTIVFDWGFELIKHDFSSFDIFGHWGGERHTDRFFADGDWTFYDTSRTSAEIYKAFLKTLLEAAGGKAYILGCNCVSHLTAGLCHINRTGDDTSGTDWSRTRRMGINTLAFRMPQNRHFYLCDADCAGFIKGKIPFSLNKQWVELLAKSGTPLFISAPNGAFSPEEFAFVQSLYAIAAQGCEEAKPLDWLYNALPRKWLVAGEERDFCWFE